MTSLLLKEIIEQKILLIRGQKVMLDVHLAHLYRVETGAINRAIKRNKDRFPPDFMFQVTESEYGSLRYQNGTLKKSGRGKHRKYLPYVFTEHGVAMLSSVLRSKKAIHVNIEIMRTFSHLRQILSTHKDLAQKLEELEKNYDSKFKIVFNTIRQLMTPPVPPRKKIGF